MRFEVKLQNAISILQTITGTSETLGFLWKRFESGTESCVENDVPDSIELLDDLFLRPLLHFLIDKIRI